MPATKEWKRLGEECAKIVNKFYKSLNDEQREQCDEINNYQGLLEADRLLQMYKEGFKLGLALAVEALTGE